MDQAMHHYTRAKSIVDLVAGMGKSDQEEIDKNKVSVLLNIAAVHMEQGEHAAACSSCTAALALDPKNVKGLVRRAQCHIARHEQQVSDPSSPSRTHSVERRLAHCLRDFLLTDSCKPPQGWDCSLQEHYMHDMTT